MKSKLSLAAISASFVATTLLVPGMASASTAQRALSSTWQTWQSNALLAAGHYRGEQLTLTALPTPVSDATLETATGSISIEQETMITSSSTGSGSVVMNISVLGDRQEIVTETTPGSGGGGATLVLQPGAERVAHSYTIGSVGTQLGSYHPYHTVAHFVTVGGCSAFAYAPSVIGSIFGLLVQGEGTISCLVNESLSAIVSLYVGSTHVGTTAGGTDVGTWLGVNSYDPCVSGGPYAFHTAELWAVNGVLQGGATSSTSVLGCAL